MAASTIIFFAIASYAFVANAFEITQHEWVKIKDERIN